MSTESESQYKRLPAINLKKKIFIPPILKKVKKVNKTK